jgi:hypothetical protein
LNSATTQIEELAHPRLEVGQFADIVHERLKFGLADDAGCADDDRINFIVDAELEGHDIILLCKRLLAKKPNRSETRARIVG